MKAGTLAGVTAALLLSSAAARADVEIANRPTSNMDCISGVCTATAQKAVLNAGDLATMLASGDVAVKTGLVAKDIDVDQPLQWTSTSRLTLDAQQSVTVKKQITVAGQGALTVVTNDTGGNKAKNKTGEFVIVPERGSVQFWDLGSSLIVDGNSYTLVGDIKTLASDIAANPSGFYALAKPYDASVDGAYTSSPIATSFQGTLEGLGNHIISMTIIAKGEASASLITAVESNGLIRDIGMIKADIYAQSNGPAVLAGNNLGTIFNCWANGSIAFPVTVDAGGLVSENDGLIANSWSDVHIVGSGPGTAVATLVGYNYTTGVIRSSYAVRSLALKRAAVQYIGGLVGESAGKIEDSFSRTGISDGRRSDNENYGGFVGQTDMGAQTTSTYAAGRMGIKSQATAGGLIGRDETAAGSIQHSYWDLDMGISDPSRGAGNIANDPGITGLQTAQFQSGLPKGFDPKIWAIDPQINSGFPYLRQLPPK